MSSDIRAALERLVELNGQPLLWSAWMDAIAAASAALAAEPVGDGPSDNDLRAMASKLVKIHVDSFGCVYDVLPFARAVLARWGRPAAPPAPEPGEVGELVELVEWIHREAIHGPDADEWRRAATLLQQQAAPASAVVPVGECPHCGYEGEMARVPQAGEVQT